MTDSLTQLIQRIQGTIPVVQPLILSQFVPESAIATTNLFASVFHPNSLTADFPFSAQSQSSISSEVSSSVSPAANSFKTSENSNLLSAFTSKSTLPASASLSVWWGSAPERSNSMPFQLASAQAAFSQAAFSQAEQSERFSSIVPASVSSEPEISEPKISEPEISEQFNPVQTTVSDVSDSVSAKTSLAQAAFSEPSNSISSAIPESLSQTSISTQTNSILANQPISEQSSVSSNLISSSEGTASAFHPSQINPAIPKPLNPESNPSEAETVAPPQLLSSESLPAQKFISQESISAPSEQTFSVAGSISSLQSSADVVHSADSLPESEPIAVSIPALIHPVSPSASFQASSLANIQFSAEARSPQISIVQPDLQITAGGISERLSVMTEETDQQNLEQQSSKQLRSAPSEQTRLVPSSIPSLSSADVSIDLADSLSESKPIAASASVSIHSGSPSVTAIQLSTEARSPQSAAVQPDLQTPTEPTLRELPTIVENSRQQRVKQQRVKQQRAKQQLSEKHDREDAAVVRDRNSAQQTQRSTELQTATLQTATPQVAIPQTAITQMTSQMASQTITPQTAPQNSVEISRSFQPPVLKTVSPFISSHPENHPKSDRPSLSQKNQPTIQSLAHLRSESDSNQSPEVAQPLTRSVIRPIARPVPPPPQTELASGPIGDRREPSLRSSKAAPEPPIIQVTIGRIEVRKTEPAPAPSSRRTAQQKPSLSLKDYLQQRSTGGSS